jgi:hypothetical protein
VLDTSSPTAGFVFAAIVGLTSIPLYLQAASKKYGKEGPPIPSKRTEGVQKM